MKKLRGAIHTTQLNPILAHNGHEPVLSRTTIGPEGYCACFPISANFLPDSYFSSTGSIFRSSNSGASWNQSQSDNINYLAGISFNSTGVGLIVGIFGQIQRSEDKGQTWTRMPDLTESYLSCVEFVDDAVALAVGSDGQIFRSEDAGQTWADFPGCLAIHQRP